MSRKAVEELLGRIILDEAFRKEVHANPRKATAGFDLSADERRGFDKLDLAEFNGMINRVWDRASVAFGFTQN